MKAMQVNKTMQPRGTFRGFDVLSTGKGGGFGLIQEDERIPEVFVWGRAPYSANLNATNPIGAVQSSEHALRTLDKHAAEQRNRVARIEKELADYQTQADRPFEHEERLKQLLAERGASPVDLAKWLANHVRVAATHNADQASEALEPDEGKSLRTILLDLGKGIMTALMSRSALGLHKVAVSESSQFGAAANAYWEYSSERAIQTVRKVLEQAQLPARSTLTTLESPPLNSSRCSAEIFIWRFCLA